MTYEEWITTSKTWTCPKAGIWEIICVGGGASGRLSPTSDSAVQNSGGTTSFGSLLSAAGGQAYPSGLKIGLTDSSGLNGYTGLSYGESSLGDGASGVGYGAGGGASGKTTNPAVLALGGDCGELKSITLDLNANQSVVCTIGTGGAQVTSGTYVGLAGKAGCIHVRFIQ